MYGMIARSITLAVNETPRQSFETVADDIKTRRSTRVNR